MFLKRIILKNFKSFKGKTILEFPFLITAIIGPNGSGKSNIVDAIRWALGEQSFKNIRADKGQDLIFTGKEKDSSVSFCEVELIFDNQNNVFPLDYNEISLLRRIDRDGNNSYFLNHKPCRLKDIIDLTAHAQIGLKGFSIINQGSVESILLVSPQERRLMLEEVLGLKNIELKKEEAKRKLEETDINLDKSLALEKEILPHLRSLKRQVTRWETREKIQENLSLSEKQYFAIIFHNIVEDNKPLGLNLDELTQKLSLINQEIKDKETNLMSSKEEGQGNLEKQVQQITREIIEMQNQKSNLLRDLGRQEVKTTFSLSPPQLESSINKIINQLKELLNIEDIKLVHIKIQNILNGLNDLINYQNKSVKQDVEKIKKDLSLLEAKLILKKQELKQNEETINNQNKSFRGAFEEITNLRTQKEELLKQIQIQNLEKEKYSLRLEDFKRRLQEANLEYEVIEKYYQDHTNELSFNEEQLSSLEKQVLRLRREMADIGTEDLNVVKEYQEVSKRYEFLSQQIADLKQGSQDLKGLIKELTQEIEKTFEKSLTEINKDFNRYFRLMFSGGSAKLEQIKKQKLASLDEEEKSLEPQVKEEPQDSYWGVEIKVEVPKTELKSLEMLSGGEKTLVAISLLFAIINQSDPPLVIVDEIDAALDEYNSQRFSQIIKELCKNTQFITITHNRMTMSVAEVIYGVTIGEDNTSQLLSIKLEDSEKILN
ncbi:MAG: AAA family ATPase [Minisyncoccia bacterium]